MVPLNAILALLRAALAEWQNLRLLDLRFAHQDAARLVLVAVAALSLVLLVLRAAIAEAPGRAHVALPAILGVVPQSRLAWTRHVPSLLFAVGLVCFGVALAGPFTAIAREEMSFPGRRIALMIDASSSMVAPFKAARLNVNAPRDAAFYTSIGAAERFLQMRRQGRYHDLISLIEFGNQAYVVTPFTADYDNILLSISLISDLTEWAKFPDQGTIIVQAIEQGVELFRAFDFLDASGNLLIMFSDGQDTQVTVHGRSLDDILAAAVASKIPVYFIRTNYDRPFGRIVPDAIWQPAIEKTGGKFYAASDEATILQAIQEIDRLSAGKIVVTQYSTERPRFAPFAVAAAGCWALALVLKLIVPGFRRFP